MNTHLKLEKMEEAFEHLSEKMQKIENLNTNKGG